MLANPGKRRPRPTAWRERQRSCGTYFGHVRMFGDSETCRTPRTSTNGTRQNDPGAGRNDGRRSPQGKKIVCADSLNPPVQPPGRPERNLRMLPISADIIRVHRASSLITRSIDITKGTKMENLPVELVAQIFRGLLVTDFATTTGNSQHAVVLWNNNSNSGVPPSNNNATPQQNCDHACARRARRGAGAAHDRAKFCASAGAALKAEIRTMAAAIVEYFEIMCALLRLPCENNFNERF